MSTFGDSQVRNLFIAPSFSKATADVTADYVTWAVENGKVVIKSHDGDGHVVRSQAIDPKNVISASFKAAADLEPKAFIATSTIAGTIAAGDVFEVTAYLDEYGANKTTDAGIFKGFYKAKAGDTAALVATGLADSIAANIKASKLESQFLVADSGDTVIVEYLRAPFVLGKFNGAPGRGRVTSKTNSAAGTITTASNYQSATPGAFVNGVELANLEWFVEGNRGEVYRDANYPNNFSHKYVADPTAAYGVYEIAFYTERLSAPGDKQRQMVTIAAVQGADDNAGNSAATFAAAHIATLEAALNA